MIVHATLKAFSKWIAGTWLSNTIQSVTWVVPTVQTVHIVCVGIVISSAFLVDMRVLGLFAQTQSLAGLSQRLLTWIWWPILVLLVTGALLIIGEPMRSLLNPTFGAKMLMLLMVAGLTRIMQRPLATDVGYWDRTTGRRLALKGIAIASLVLWSCIVFAGRWIDYTY